MFECTNIGQKTNIAIMVAENRSQVKRNDELEGVIAWLRKEVLELKATALEARARDEASKRQIRELASNLTVNTVRLTELEAHEKVTAVSLKQLADHVTQLADHVSVTKSNVVIPKQTERGGADSFLAPSALHKSPGPSPRPSLNTSTHLSPALGVKAELTPIFNATGDLGIPFSSPARESSRESSELGSSEKQNHSSDRQEPGAPHELPASLSAFVAREYPSHTRMNSQQSNHSDSVTPESEGLDKPKLAFFVQKTNGADESAEWDSCPEDEHSKLAGDWDSCPEEEDPSIALPVVMPHEKMNVKRETPVVGARIGTNSIATLGSSSPDGAGEFMVEYLTPRRGVVARDRERAGIIVGLPSESL